jgi:hypothetical protein
MLGPFALQTKEDGPFYAIAGAWSARFGPECSSTHPFQVLYNDQL